LDSAHRSLRVFGQNQQNVLSAKHVHRLLDRRWFVESLQKNRRNRVCGGALPKMLEAFCGPDAVRDEHTAVPSQQPTDFGKIIDGDMRHWARDADLPA
jgi:hypothetical protein